MRIGYVTRLAVMSAAVAVIAAPTTADAQRTASGVGPNGLAWQAQSRIVGVTSTGTIASGGNPIYTAPAGAGQPYSGVVTLIMRYANGDAFICSGSLLADRQSILTAAHCVSGGAGTANPVSTTVYFPESDVDGVPFASTTSASRTITQYIVHPQYTGEVIDQNDIAVLRMSAPAPASALSYGLFTPPTLTGVDFNVAGYGARSNAGGNVGANLGTGRLRQGDNRYDFRFGDSDFGGFWTDRDATTGENFFGLANIDNSYVSDFDNGLAANDASCRIAAAIGTLNASSTKYCNLGRGATEVSVGGGDSGGPQFRDGRISSVTSYGLSFGAGFGDILTGLNSSFGEFNGFVPVYIHLDFINNSVVPEPETFALMAVGLVVLGVISRRRRIA
jgi:hypothetical protein